MKFGKTFDKSLGVCLRHIRYCCCCAWQLLGMSRCLNTQPIDASFSPFEVSPLRLTALQLELFAFSVSADSATETFFSVWAFKWRDLCGFKTPHYSCALGRVPKVKGGIWVGSSPFRWTFSACLDWSDSSKRFNRVLLPKMRYDERTNQPAKITQKSIRRTNLRGRGEEWEGRTCRCRDDAVRGTKSEKNTQMRINGATNRSNRELRRERSRNDGRQKLGSRSTYANKAIRGQEPTLNLIWRKIVTFIDELFDIKENAEDLVEGTMMCLTPSIFWYLKLALSWKAKS